ncbi:hypothetical protein [Phytohabitans rumicis]|uniref:hypothetical protein n=1 Tax=Phytohabitans rumicis TaxID=1076125 RepID=UPI0031F12D99
MSRIDPSRRPPGRRWYAVAGGAALLGVAASGALLVTGILSWIEDFPALGDRFRGGESVRVDLRAGQPAVLYVSPDTASYDWRCTGTMAGAPVAVTEAPYTFTFFSGGRTWAARYELRADRDGSVDLTCAPAAQTRSALLAVGEEPDNGRLLRKLATTVAASGAAAVLGLAVGGVLTVVVWRRRRAYRPG